jgi:hypothetical protein
VISSESVDLRWFALDNLPDGIDAGLTALIAAAERRFAERYTSLE